MPLFKPEPDALEHHLSAPLPNTKKVDINLVRQILESLDHYGLAEALELPNPNIVMVGDQSSGKSSLVEAISQIKVPRDDSTCTRVPLEINLAASNGPWQATISVLRKFDKAEPQESRPKGTKLALWPWKLRPHPEHFTFMTVDDPVCLAQAILWAQLAVLSPSTPIEHFKQQAEAGNKYEVKSGIGFSPNPVIVDITGADVPNLSFKDLPGIIAQASEAEGGLNAVNLIKDIATFYANQKNTLVVLVVSMESDIDTSSSSALITKLKIKNCCGVLTKADRLASLNVQQWLEVLEGRKYPRLHGYYVTKQPGKPDVSYESAREQELEFFGQDSWTSRFSSISDTSLGTAHVKQVLESYNERMVRDHLPAVYDKVQLALEDVSQRLEAMPIPKDPNSEIRRIVWHFQSALRDATSLYAGPPRLLEKINEQKETFGELLFEKKAPTIQVKEDLVRHSDRSRITPHRLRQPVFKTPTDLVTIQDDERSSPKTPSTFQMTTPSSMSTTALKRSRDSSLDSDHADFTPRGIWFYLKKWNFCGQGNWVDRRAIAEIFKTCIDWSDAVSNFFNAIDEVLRSEVKTMLQEVLQPFKGCQIEKEIFGIVSCYITEILKQQKLDVMRLYEREKLSMCARNEEIYAALLNKEHEVLKATRYALLAERTWRINKNISILEELNEEARKKMKRDIHQQSFKDLVNSDPYSQEILVMAQLKARYSIAATRFIEVVWMGIDFDVNQFSNADLFSQLLEKAANDSNYATLLLEQDPEKLLLRERLLKKQENLTEIWDKLNTLSSAEELSESGAALLPELQEDVVMEMDDSQ